MTDITKNIDGEASTTGQVVIASFDDSYAAANAGSGGKNINRTNGLRVIEVTNSANADTYALVQSFCKIDISTSDIPRGSRILDAHLDWYAEVIDTSGGNFYLEVYEYDWGAAIGTEDWRSGAALGSLLSSGKRHGYLQIGSMTVDAYNTLTAGSGLKDYVQAAVSAGGGTLKFCISNDKMRVSSPAADPSIRSTRNWIGTNPGTPLRLVVTYRTNEGFLFQLGAPM